MNIRLVLEYSGSKFHGWQKQPGLRTIQQALEETLALVLRRDISGLNASGRTDAGVHARGQVVNFHLVGVEPVEIDLSALKHSVSHLLKGEVSVVRAELAAENFDARFDAKSKQYSYRILWRAAPATIDHGFVWHISSDLHLQRMQTEARALLGQHDFTSFRGAKCTARSPIRAIFESEFIEQDPYLIYRVVGSGFLKQMVRNIVGTLVWIGKGKITRPVSEILAAKDRRCAGMTAPACGLCLDWVRYTDHINDSAEAVAQN